MIEIWRRLPAPVAEVFRWWTEADRLREWMSPIGNVEAEVDLRVGGALRIVMSAGGTVIEHFGEFNYRRFRLYLWGAAYEFVSRSLSCYRMILRLPAPAGSESAAK